MESDIVYRIIIKLLGKISPVGETNTDGERFENLKQHCDLVNKLLYDINQVGYYKDRHEYSMKVIGEYADKFMKEIKQDF